MLFNVFPFFVLQGIILEFFIVRVKISMHRMNKKPAMGSSYLHPCSILNWSVGCPFTTLTPVNFAPVLEFPNKMLIHWQFFFPNQKISSVFWMKAHAFSKSTSIASPGVFVLVACSNELYVFFVALLIYLSGIYAF